MAGFDFVRYEEVDDGAIVRILLNRPEKRNAQSRALLVELHAALLRAEADDKVKVVILGGIGPVFSSGHDMTDGWSSPDHPHSSTKENGGTREGMERHMLQEWHHYYENTRRWRDLRKITIAQVQGPVIAAGLMLMWACDLIVAADDTTFCDVTGSRLGMCGVEYFAHPWEFGARRTKELMLTGDAIDVDEAYRIGMVSKVFPREHLEDRTLAFARRIAAVPTMAALLIKESVNQTQENQGFLNAVKHSFHLHTLGHAAWAVVNETRETAIPAGQRGSGPIVVKSRDQP